MKKSAPLLLLFLLAFTACRKNDDPPPAAECRTATMIVNTAAATSVYSFSYNSDGKVNRVVNDNNVITFDYGADGYVVTFSSSGKMYKQTTVKIDAQQRPASAAVKHYKADGTFDPEAITCTYNSRGELVQQVSQKKGLPAETTSTVWVNGNCTVISNNAQSQTMEYYADKPVQQADIFRINQLLLHGFVNVFNKNLAKSMKSGASVIQFTYEFDASGRITTATLTTGGQSEARSFQYDCD
ncbi:hypothetical protein [Chitinophaga caseinilytica]|uniref:hypothetical protein n=1 Tax=Chitinophaga caseinilytica TaxID=2267521 RepID=UPI003C2EF931